jgi:hypothetical protein
MRIDFINDGSHDTPIIRLLSDEKDEIAALCAVICTLGNAESTGAIISDLPMSQSRLKLTFSANNGAAGIRVSKDTKDLSVELSTEAWLSVCGKLEPFLARQSGFAWLYESKFNSLLFTTDGYW